MPSYFPAKCRNWLARDTILPIFPCPMLFAQSRNCEILKSTRNVSFNICMAEDSQQIYVECALARTGHA